MTIQFRAFLLCAWLIAVAGTTIASEDQYFNSNGVEIRYTVIGSGAPVILIHGFTVDFETNWQQATEILAPHFQVIGLDARGHGKSGKPHSESNYGIELVLDVIRLMDHLGIEKAHVAGYSMGGIITLKLASIYPDRLLSAVLGGSGQFTLEELTMIAAQHQARLQQVVDQGVTLADLAFPRDQEVPPALSGFVERLREMNHDPVALSACVGSLQKLALSEGDAAALHIPLRAIYGSLDELSGTVTRLKANQAATDVVVVEGQNHLTTFLAPEFARAVLEFLKSQAR